VTSAGYPCRYNSACLLKVHGVSHPGNRRKTNEDAMIWDAAIGFVAVADGMGGHLAGEVASRMALDSISAFVRKSAETDDITWPFGVNPGLSAAANRLVTAMKIGNRRVFSQSAEVPAYLGMGTTVVALIADDSRATFSSVGDSRLYSFAGGELRQLTRDDSWAVMLAEESGVSREELRKHPMRNVLTNVLGAKAELEVSVGEIALNGQTLMFCSDGLHTALPHDVMTSILARERGLKQAAETLLRSALDLDGSDNITIVLARAG
jgi:PPM family protein phosphatase